MNWCLSVLPNALTKLWSPAMAQVRLRHYWHQDKIDAGPLIRRYGYENKILQRGMLPHIKHKNHLPSTQYLPQDKWNETRALFGQNDYIDIWTGNIHPTKILYNVPAWLRGAGGNELQMLIRKRKMLVKGSFPKTEPTRWKNINKRINYLYKYLNRKTRTWFIYGNKLKR